jgi:hypothetical protein
MHSASPPAFPHHNSCCCPLQRLAACSTVPALRRIRLNLRTGTRRSCSMEYSHTAPKPSARMALFNVLQRSPRYAHHSGAFASGAIARKCSPADSASISPARRASTTSRTAPRITSRSLRRITGLAFRCFVFRIASPPSLLFMFLERETHCHSRRRRSRLSFAFSLAPSPSRVPLLPHVRSAEHAQTHLPLSLLSPALGLPEAASRRRIRAASHPPTTKPRCRVTSWLLYMSSGAQLGWAGAVQICARKNSACSKRKDSR